MKPQGVLSQFIDIFKGNTINIEKECHIFATNVWQESRKATRNEGKTI